MISKDLIKKVIYRRLQYFENNGGIYAFIDMITDIIFAAQASPVITTVLNTRLTEMRAENDAQLLALDAMYDEQKAAAMSMVESENADITAVLPDAPPEPTPEPTPEPAPEPAPEPTPEPTPEPAPEPPPTEE